MREAAIPEKLNGPERMQLIIPDRENARNLSTRRVELFPILSEARFSQEEKH
jgi:hypothetical protein